MFAPAPKAIGYAAYRKAGGYRLIADCLAGKGCFGDTDAAGMRRRRTEEEQARGKPVDKRTDIWAFGCVLFEMLTGCRAFGGDDVSEVVASVLARDPEWARLPAALSPTNSNVFSPRSAPSPRSARCWVCSAPSSA